MPQITTFNQPALMQVNRATSRILALDGIRGIAALMVMFRHFAPWPSFFPDFFREKISVFGHIGVSLFFCLSGFLITRILLDSKNQEHYFRNFYARRTLRIFPLYYFVTLFTFFVFPALTATQIPPFTEQIYTYLFLQDFPITFGWPFASPAAFWSLAVEEHFYLFWPLIVYAFTGKKNLTIALSAIIAVSITTRIILAKNGYEVYYFTFSRLDELSLGSLMAVFGFGSPNKSQAKFCLSIFLPGLFLTILLWSKYSGQALPNVQIIKYSFISITFSAFVGFIISADRKNLIKLFCQNRFLLFTGRVSYGLYVFHPICFWVAYTHLKTGYFIVDFLLSFFCTYLISTLSFYYFESFFLRLKRKFKN